MTRGGRRHARTPAAVEVRYAFVRRLAPRVRARLLALLSDDERARHDRFRAEADRDTYLAAHALLRIALARRAGVTPEALRFAAKPDVKPELAFPPATGLGFSLTHGRGIVACAIAPGSELGVDAEDLGRRVRARRLAERVLSPRERAVFGALDPRARRRRFFEAWSLREAYAKATGIGMARTLGTVEFTFARRHPSIRFLAGQKDRSAAWSFRMRHVSPRHVLTVAARAPRIRVRWSEVALPILPRSLSARAR
jgi:4'-phosphopantetheinyl transferase